jgi:glutathione S-transferase
MPSHWTPTLFAAFAVVCTLLVLKAQILGAATAATRGKLKKFLNAEDAAWLGGTHENSDEESVQRIFRAHRNDLENLLPFFIGGSLYIISGGSVILGEVYFGAFLVVRYAYSFAYLTQKARLRRDSYTIGWLVTIVMGAHAAWNAVLIALK